MDVKFQVIYILKPPVNTQTPAVQSNVYMVSEYNANLWDLDVWLSRHATYPSPLSVAHQTPEHRTLMLDPNLYQPDGRMRNSVSRIHQDVKQNTNSTTNYNSLEPVTVVSMFHILQLHFNKPALLIVCILCHMYLIFIFYLKYRSWWPQFFQNLFCLLHDIITGDNTLKTG